MWQVFKDIFIVFPKWLRRKNRVVLRAYRTDSTHIEIINDCEVTLKDFIIEDREKSIWHFSANSYKIFRPKDVAIAKISCISATPNQVILTCSWKGKLWGRNEQEVYVDMK